MDSQFLTLVGEEEIMNETKSGLEIRGCQEPRAPLNSPAAPSNFCREPKDVLFSIQNSLR